MNESIGIHGRLQVYRVRNDVRELLINKHNLINATMLNNLANVLISRSVEYGVDCIAWGSFSAPGGTFVDSSWSGTTSSGTQGALIQGRILNIATFTGTFSFTGNKSINMFRIGRGYTAAGAGVTEILSSIYASDSSLLTGSTWLSYINGDAMILTWSLTAG